MTVGIEARSGGPARIGKALLGREVALAFMVVIYILVSAVVYTDYPRGHTGQPLTALEREGLGVWRRNNCQACHQIYGFGGFLGPDLTNRITQDTLDEEIEWILEEGSGRMPALRLPEEDRAAVLAFLRAVNRTGQSQPTPLAARREVVLRDHFGWLTDTWARREGREMPAPVVRGVEVWGRYGCGACHVPFTIGDNLAPDLTASSVDRSAIALGEIISSGRGRMPSADLAPSEVDDLRAFLEWVASRRGELADLNDEILDREKFTWSGIPWFEYR